MKSLEHDLAQVSIAAKFKFLPQDFKDCFWSNAEQCIAEFKK